jgi:hypothetical protein
LLQAREQRRSATRIFNRDFTVSLRKQPESPRGRGASSAQHERPARFELGEMPFGRIEQRLDTVSSGRSGREHRRIPADPAC